MTDGIMRAAVLAYEFASDEPLSERALRASRALRMQREENALAIEAATGTDIYVSRTTAARIAREHGKGEVP